MARTVSPEILAHKENRGEGSMLPFLAFTCAYYYNYNHHRRHPHTPHHQYQLWYRNRHNPPLRRWTAARGLGGPGPFGFGNHGSHRHHNHRHSYNDNAYYAHAHYAHPHPRARYWRAPPADYTYGERHDTVARLGLGAKPPELLQL